MKIVCNTGPASAVVKQGVLKNRNRNRNGNGGGERSLKLAENAGLLLRTPPSRMKIVCNTGPASASVKQGVFEERERETIAEARFVLLQ